MKKKIRNISLIGWLLSLVIFVGLLVWMNRLGNQSPYTDIVAKSWLGDILFGIIAFLVLIFSLGGAGKKSEHTKPIAEKVSLNHKHRSPSWIFVCLFILFLLYAYQAGRTGSLVLGIQIYPTPTNLPTPTQPIFVEDCVVNGVIVHQSKEACDILTSTPPSQKTYIVQPAVDSDPPVHCQIHANCGGGTTPLKKSECEKSICCGSTFYKDISQSPCANTQTRNTTSGSSVITPKYPPCVVYYPTTKSTLTYTTFSPEQCQSAKNNASSSTISTCIVSYPCTGKSYTYQASQQDCAWLQRDAASTCSLQASLDAMGAIGSQPLPSVVVPSIDTAIHMDPTPTIGVPFGFSNYPDAK